jgi:hypothetical protein
MNVGMDGESLNFTTVPHSDMEASSLDSFSQ